MSENTSTAQSAPEATQPWPLKVRQEVALAALGITKEHLFALKLRRRKIGRTTFYDPEQVAALMALKHAWLGVER
jgi:hypothetical protein